MGGRANFEKITSSQTKAVMTANSPMGEMNVDMEMYSASQPDRFLIKRTIPGFGEISEGSDGKVTWSLNPMNGGYSLVPPQDAEGMSRQARIHELLLHIEEEFPSLETVDKVAFGGEECFKVKMVNQSGEEQFSFFRVADKRLAGLEQSEETPMGQMTATVTFSDWKQFGDLNLYTKMSVEQGGQQMQMVLNEIKFNAIDPTIFQLPEAVRELMNEQATSRPDMPESRPE